MDTYFLVKRDGTFYEQDGRTLFTIEEANEIAADAPLAITPAFILPDPS